ncbi:MAG TPA: wax ester/triacylglycerol synthase family O-acyltransferase [Actinomycetota bacterium]|nr:wax ester/triacylglycerol synthase family O-acyltransferase [Actinomycetota bacterium]
MPASDATFLYMETATTPMHVLGVLLLDTSTMTGGPPFERIKELLEARIHLMPAFRRRLVPVPLDLAHPVWIQDPDFDLEQHLRRMTVPAPGDLRALAEAVGQIAGSPLARTRPLWEMWVMEGITEDRVAVVTKVHHSTMDGTTGADLMVHLLDPTPEVAPTPPPEEAFTGEPRPSDLRLLAGGLANVARWPVRAAGQMARTVSQLPGMAGSVFRRGDGGGPTLPFTAPRTSFSGALGRHRSVAFGQSSLDDLKTIKATLGGKVNDVVLAIAAHAMRAYLEWRGQLPDRPLLAGCPISVKDDTGQNEAANQISSMLVQLPVHEPDPVRRLELIVESTKRSKELAKAVGAEALQDWSDFLAPRLFTLGMRLYSSLRVANLHPPMQNVIVSNVPGPPVPLYVAGGRVLAIYPMGPLLPGAGVNITILSNMGSVDMGIIADRDTVPEVWRIAEGLEEGVRVLLEAAQARD